MQEAKRICEETVNQASSEARFKARTIRVNASKVKQILAKKPTTNPENLVQRWTLRVAFLTEAIMYGGRHKADALLQFSKLMLQFTESDICMENGGQSYYVVENNVNKSHKQL